MAMPTVTPTRCPTPISASDRLAPKVEPPAPTRNAVEISLLITFRAASRENPAATSEATRMARRLLRFSSAPLFGVLADLEHLGRGHAFRIGQVGPGDQGAAQRHGIHHAEGAADGRTPPPSSSTGSPATSRS